MMLLYSNGFYSLLGIKRYGCKTTSEIPQTGNYRTSREHRRKSGSVKGTGMSYTECSEEIENEGLIITGFQCNESNLSALNDKNTKGNGNL